MILLKGFLRKKKTRIYSKIFIIISTIIFLLNGLNNYIVAEADKMNKETTSLILFSKENRENLLKKEKMVKAYKRALGFDVGLDNDIIYKSQVREDGSSYKMTDEDNEAKLYWDSLLYEDVILAFSASSCKVSLDDNEVILNLNPDYYNPEYLSNYLNQEITFKYKNQGMVLIIKNILDSSKFNYICISDSLYNDLISKDANYIYDIEATNHKSQQKLKNKWADLEDNDFFKLDLTTYQNSEESANRSDLLDNMVVMLEIANIVSLIVFLIVLLFVSKDLVSDEENNMLLLKQVWYNMTQNILNSLKNVLVLDFLSVMSSSIIYILLIGVLKLIFKISLTFLSWSFITLYFSFIFIIESLFLIGTLKNLKSSTRE